MARVYSLKLKPAPQVTSMMVVNDVHVPMEDKMVVRAIEKRMAVMQPDYFVINGDFMDFDCISSHNENLLRKVEGKTLARDYKYANAILDRWQNLCPGSQFVFVEGNHDYRTERLVDANPRLAGLVEFELQLRLEERGFLFVPYWRSGSVWKFGKLYGGHGKYTNEHHAKKHAAAYGKNFIYGHTHDTQMHSIVYEGDGETRMAVSNGCVCRYGLDYKKGDPDKWQHAYSEVYARSNGFFTHNLVRIFNGQFIAPDGEMYDGRTI